MNADPLVGRLLGPDGRLRRHEYTPDAYLFGMGDCVCGHTQGDEIHVRAVCTRADCESDRARSGECHCSVYGGETGS